MDELQAPYLVRLTGVLIENDSLLIIKQNV